MDVGLLRKEGVEVDAKNLLDPDESSNEDWARDGPFGRNNGMGPEFQTRSLVPSNSRLECDLGNLLLLRLGARLTLLQTLSLPIGRIPLREPPCRVWQVGEAVSALLLMLRSS